MLLAVMSAPIACILAATTVLAIAAWLFDVVDKRRNPPRRYDESDSYQKSSAASEPVPTQVFYAHVEELEVK